MGCLIMAGTLRSYEMPNLTLSAKKRERVDVQDRLWKETGLEPIEGGAEEQAAAEALQNVKVTPNGPGYFETAVEKAIQSRLKTEKPNKLWDRVVQTYKDLQETKKTGDPNDFDKVYEELETAYNDFIQNEEPPLKKKEENIPLKKTIVFAQDILKMGMSYLDIFMGMVATRLADRYSDIYFKKKTPLVSQVDSVEEFIEKNLFLGEPILTMVASQYNVFDPVDSPFIDKVLQKRVRDVFSSAPFGVPLPPPKGGVKAQLIGADLLATGNLLNLLLSKRESVGFISDEKKQWVFHVLDLAALSEILTPGSLGAVLSAYEQIKRIRGCSQFTLKQLLMSEGVRDMFAIFVAFQYQLASGGNAYAGRASTQGNAKGTTFMLSAGLETRRQLNLLVLGAKNWFADVYEEDNPVHAKAVKDLDDKRQFYQNLNATPVTRAQMDLILTDNINFPHKALALEHFIRDASFDTLSEGDQLFVNKTLEIFQKELFLEGMPKKFLRHAN